MKDFFPQFSERHWLAAIIFGFVFLIGPGSIDGSINPAAAPMVLDDAILGPPEQISGQDQQTTIFWGKSARLRPWCSPIRMEWFLGRRSTRGSPITQWSWGPPKVRPDGEFSFGPWSVTGVSPSVFRYDVYGDVIHGCSLIEIRIPDAGNKLGYRVILRIPLPWETRTPFWN